MGVLYDYFRAPDDTAATRLGQTVGGPVAAGHPGVVETKWVDPRVRVAQVLTHLQGIPWTYDASRVIRVMPQEEPGPDNWDVPTVERLADQIRDVLADVPVESRAEVGRWWATTEEFTRDRADPTYVEALCESILALCSDARDNGDHVYVWSSL
jgi:hypothetical protein